MADLEGYRSMETMDVEMMEGRHHGSNATVFLQDFWPRGPTISLSVASAMGARDNILAVAEGLGNGRMSLVKLRNTTTAMANLEKVPEHGDDGCRDDEDIRVATREKAILEE